MLKPKTFESSDLDEASAKDEYSVFDCDDTENDYASSIYSSFKEARLSSRRGIDHHKIPPGKTESPLKVINYSALMRNTPDILALHTLKIQTIPGRTSALSPNTKSTFYHQMSGRKCEIIIEEEPLRMSNLKLSMIVRGPGDESSCSMVRYEGSVDLNRAGEKFSLK